MRIARVVWVAAVLAAAPLYALAQRGQRAASPPAVAAPTTPAAPAARALPGWPLYDRFCLACHGVRGDGAGPAAPWLDPPPRDLTAGRFKWTSTGDATAPARVDLAEVIRWGAPGTAMHGFGPSLDDAQVDALVDVVRALAGQTGEAPLPRLRYALKGFDRDGKRAQRERGAAVWKQLGCPACHGDGGRGDGPSAALLKDAAGAAHPPYDLTAGPVRRPRPDASADEVEGAILHSILWGVGGTAMPGFDGAVSLDDLMALAAHVATLGPATVEPVGDLTAAAIARDKRERRTEAGYRPGAPDDPDGALFGGVIALQGEPPAALGPAQASLSSRQCGRCHAKQVREWQGSIHAAAVSPGLIAQTAHLAGDDAESCRRCHAPLAEQQAELRPAQEGVAGADVYRKSPFFDGALYAEGLTCAACHVRGGVRHGPAARAPSLLTLPGYPLRELPVYERSDFCVGCHQLPGRIAVAGRPLLDTYREWLLGPYMKRGVQCQHCHMPNREHTWKGVHDPETFRQGIAVTAIAARTAGGTVSVRARVENVGAGHYLPTTPTPAAWLEIELVDGDGRIVAGAVARKRIGRHIRSTTEGWKELEDTRIAPGAALDLAQGWRAGRVAAATHARVRVRVRPDDYYEGVYERRLKNPKLSAADRARYQAALDRARSTPYVAYEELWPITAPPP